MEKKRIVEVVSTGPKPGKEAEYQKWYDEHIEDAFKFKGMKSATRVRCIQLPKGNYGTCPQHLTIYEYESKEAMEDFFNSPMMNPPDKQAIKEAEVNFIMYWAAAYEPTKELKR